MPSSSTLTYAPVPTPCEPWLSCLRSDAGGVVGVAAVGELDVVGAPDLERALRGAEADAELVVLDLRELEFMDAGGAHVLLAADERIRGRAHGSSWCPVRADPTAAGAHRVRPRARVRRPAVRLESFGPAAEGAPA